MADINTDSSAAVHEEAAYRSAATGGSSAGGEADEALVGLVELLFFAYRDFTGEADEVLGDLGFGRAHHRVLHFVNRQPGLRVADLLDILRITKQSLARVLKQLVDDGYIEQMAGMSDRRERRLYVTFRGESLARELMELQAARVGAALAQAQAQVGDGGEASLRAFLFAMIGPEQRANVAAVIAGGGIASHAAEAAPKTEAKTEIETETVQENPPASAVQDDAPPRDTRTR